MTESRDEELSRIYREAERPAPPSRLDDVILAASRRAVGARPRPAGSEFVRRMRIPVALAATVVLTFTVTLLVIEQEPIVDSVPLPAPRREPARVRDSASQPAQPAAAVPARPEGSPAEVSRPERAATAERAKHAERAEPTEKPAAAPPPGAGASSGSIGNSSNRSSDSAAPGGPVFAPDPAATEQSVLPEHKTMQPAPPSAPAAAAPSLSMPARQAAPKRDTASPPAAAEARERSPETWLEDIRRLKAQGRMAEAERELAEFRRRYPDYRLPADLL